MLTFSQAIGSIAHGQTTQSSNQWGLTLSANSGNSTGSSFAPFAPIDLSAKVTYGGASQPDLLVYFNVTGPQNSNGTIRFSRTGTTNSSGIADFSFRLPIAGTTENQFIGTWNAAATIQTTNGTAFEQILKFTTQWSLQIASINLLDSKGQNQTTFAPGDTMTIDTTIDNFGQTQNANVTLNMIDQQGNSLNQTQILNTTLASNASTPLQANLQIPANTDLGQKELAISLDEGSYVGVAIPVAESQAVVFEVSANGTTTNTATPTSTPPAQTTSPQPSPTINQIENSVSLFSWLLVATGIFTFTSLVAFLRRKPLNMNPQMANMPVMTATQKMTGAQVSSTMEKPVDMQPNEGSTRVSSQAASTIAIPSVYMDLASSKPQSTADNAQIENSKDLVDIVPSQLAKIEEIGKRIQVLQESLDLEKKELAKEIQDLNGALEQKEREIKAYFDSIRNAVAKMNPDQNKQKSDQS
jgi:hypothetical protein